MKRSAARISSFVTLGAHDSISTISPWHIPGRRLAIGPRVLIEGTGHDILEFLGDDLQERAEEIDEILLRCDDPELEQIMEALNEALMIRARREEAEEKRKAAIAQNGNGHSNGHRNGDEESDPGEWTEWRVRRYDRRAERLERREERRRRRDDRYAS